MPEEYDDKKEKTVTERYSSATYYPESEKIITTDTKIYQDGTMEKTNEEISYKIFGVADGGIKSDALVNYLDKTEAKNKNGIKKDGKHDNNSDTSNQS